MPDTLSLPNSPPDIYIYVYIYINMYFMDSEGGEGNGKR